MEVYKTKSAENPSELIQKAKTKEGLLSTDLRVLQSDKGSPKKRTVMLETLYKSGISHSNSCPRVSNDNSFAKMLKDRQNYQLEDVTFFKRTVWEAGAILARRKSLYEELRQRILGDGEGVIRRTGRMGMWFTRHLFP